MGLSVDIVSTPHLCYGGVGWFEVRFPERQMLRPELGILAGMLGVRPRFLEPGFYKEVQGLGC